MFVAAFSYVIYSVYVILFLAGLLFIILSVRTRYSRPSAARMLFLVVGAVLILIPLGLILDAELAPGV